MLTARTGALLASLLALGTPLADAMAAPAERVTCPPGRPTCVIVVETPESPGTTAAAASTQADYDPPSCTIPDGLLGAGKSMSCTDPDFGTWSNADGCYYRLADPQPPASSPLWEGHYPDGAIYESVCFGYQGTGGGAVWRATPPAGLAAPTVSPAELAQRAVELLRLEGPDIGMAPEAGRSGLVGLPVWLWTAVAPRTWGPVSATASVPGLSVTATARAQRITWSMGDGHSVTCTGPGTPYRESLGARRSPDCGHVYAQPSTTEPGGTYRVRATTTWRVIWAGGGDSGVITVTRSSSTALEIGELQVLIS